MISLPALLVGTLAGTILVVLGECKRRRERRRREARREAQVRELVRMARVPPEELVEAELGEMFPPEAG